MSYQKHLKLTFMDVTETERVLDLTTTSDANLVIEVPTNKVSIKSEDLAKALQDVEKFFKENNISSVHADPETQLDRSFNGCIEYGEDEASNS